MKPYLLFLDAKKSRITTGEKRLIKETIKEYFSFKKIEILPSTAGVNFYGHCVVEGNFWENPPKPRFCEWARGGVATARFYWAIIIFDELRRIRYNDEYEVEGIVFSILKNDALTEYFRKANPKCFRRLNTDNICGIGDPLHILFNSKTEEHVLTWAVLHELGGHFIPSSLHNCKNKNCFMHHPKTKIRDRKLQFCQKCSKHIPVLKKS